MSCSKARRCQAVPCWNWKVNRETSPQIYDREESALIPNFTGQEAVNALAPKSEAALEKERLQKAENAAKLKEVEQQQEEFGEKK